MNIAISAHALCYNFCMSSRRLAIANWKMNPPTLVEAKKIFAGITMAASKTRNLEVVVCPPAPFIAPLKAGYSGKKIVFGAQNVHHEEKGSKTGEYAASMLKSIGVGFCIAGHSERRAMGEDNALIAKKIERIIAAGMTAVLCVGERERDNSGAYLGVLKEQLKSALDPLPRVQFANIVIAYEPVWAIGKTAKDAMQPSDVHGSVIFIRKTIAEFSSLAIASEIPILYGGSVEAVNANSLMRDGFMDGFLVGHASLVPAEFKEIMEAAAM